MGEAARRIRGYEERNRLWLPVREEAALATDHVDDPHDDATHWWTALPWWDRIMPMRTAILNDGWLQKVE